MSFLLCCPPRLTNRITALSQELQAQLEEEVRSHEECREDQGAVERRCMLLVSEGKETLAALGSAEWARRVSVSKLQEASKKHSHLNNQVITAGVLQRLQLKF